MATEAGEHPVTHSDEEWRRLLSPEQYAVMRGHGTERPGSCAGSSTRSGPGAFRLRGLRLGAVRGRAQVRERRRLAKAWTRQSRGRWTRDHIARTSGLGMSRTEVHCATCGSHLGHVFPTGRRRPACATASTASRWTSSGPGLRLTRGR